MQYRPTEFLTAAFIGCPDGGVLFLIPHRPVPRFADRAETGPVVRVLLL
jgi:hypothetical protein